VLDELTVSYVTTGRDVLRGQQQVDACIGPPLILADPDFDLASGDTSITSSYDRDTQSDVLPDFYKFDRLQGTRDEGLSIAKLMGVEPALGEGATEGLVKCHSRPILLHLATHGFFLPDTSQFKDTEGIGCSISNARDLNRLSSYENPLIRTGLALAGANTWLRKEMPPEDAADGILNGQDVAGLDLSTTELVVLSACETGLGESRFGEGVLGLRRSFHLAGARTIVMSLWKVPDKATCRVMVDFYRALLCGAPRIEALVMAQLRAKNVYGLPRCVWGAFICQGETGPINFPSTYSLLSDPKSE